MSYEDIIIKKIPVTGARANTVEVKVSYNIGGMNYFAGAVETRGVYIHVTPYEQYEGGRVYTGFSGVKSCILECTRYSKKKMQQAVDELDMAWVDNIVDHVINKNQLTKVEEDEQ